MKYIVRGYYNGAWHDLDMVFNEQDLEESYMLIEPLVEKIRTYEIPEDSCSKFIYNIYAYIHDEWIKYNHDFFDYVMCEKIALSIVDKFDKVKITKCAPCVISHVLII